MKQCAKCGEIKFLYDFALNKKRSDGLQNNCKNCQKEYKSAHYQANKDKVKAASAKAKQEVRDKLWAYKQDKKCADCPITDPRLFEFDHLRDKEHNISRMVANGYSWANILTEIAKCEIVCANCHRIRTWERNNGPLV